MMKSKYVFLLFGLIFLIFSCKRITEPITNNNWNNIVYTSDINGNSNLYKLNLNEHSITQLTFEGDNTIPQRSPDNKYIYFNSNGDICRMDLDGNNIINLTNSGSFEYEFSISNDGKKIVFVSDRDQSPNELYRSEVYLMNSDGSSLSRISYSKYYSQFPNFSSDNNIITYESFDYDSVKFSIHLYSIIDSVDTVITPKGLSQGFPVFSPDGEYLSYFSWDDMKLYLLDLQSKDRKEIIYGRKQIFSPDGKYLYFLSTGEGGLDIFRYDISKEIIQNLTNSQEQENSFDVTPDCQKIVMGAYIDRDSTFISQLFVKYINSEKEERLTDNIFNNYNPKFLIR